MNKQEEIKRWSELYGHPISETEYDEICHNLDGFFSILKKWDKESKEGEGPKNA